MLDAGGSAVAIDVAEQIMAQLTWEVEQTGYKVGPVITPGTEVWDLDVRCAASRLDRSGTV
jgi:hypothetical protein